MPGFVDLCRYALQEQLGWGTFGRVYRAVDERGNVWAVHNVNKPSQQAQKVRRTAAERMEEVDSCTNCWTYSCCKPAEDISGAEQSTWEGSDQEVM